MPRTWNNGILECWNNDLIWKFLILLTSLLIAFSNKPLPQFPRTQYSNFPLFQHSNCERSELSSGKEEGKNIGNREIDFPRRLALPEREKPGYFAGGVPKIWLTLMVHDDSL